MLLVFVSFLIGIMVFVKYITYKIEAKMKILCPIRKFLIKRKHPLQITALSLRIFTSSSVSTTCFTRSRGAQFEIMNCFFFKLNFYIVQYKSLSLHEVNKPSTESYVVAVHHSMQIGIFKLISAGYPAQNEVRWSWYLTSS